MKLEPTASIVSSICWYNKYYMEAEQKVEAETIFDFGTLERPYTIPAGTLGDIVKNSIVLADKTDGRVYFEFHGRVFAIDKESQWEMVSGRGEDADNADARQQISDVLEKLKEEGVGQTAN